MEAARRGPRVRITIRGIRVRLLDPDNFIAGCKSTVDGIVAAGIIEDDSKKALERGEAEILYEQAICTSYMKECTEVDIEWVIGKDVSQG